ncbi:MAG: GNAT family N-acetyltransferase [Bradymonadia bacterium]
MQIVRASIKDLSQLREIWKHAFSHFGYSIEVYESMFFDLNGCGWVGLHNGTVIGGLMGVKHSGSLEITSIAVVAEKRRTGVGERLVKEAMNFAQLSGVREIFFHTQPANQAAIRLFEGCGFHFVKADGAYHTGELAHRYRVWVGDI